MPVDWLQVVSTLYGTSNGRTRERQSTNKTSVGEGAQGIFEERDKDSHIWSPDVECIWGSGCPAERCFFIHHISVRVVLDDIS
jgi:hypothetical protein